MSKPKSKELQVASRIRTCKRLLKLLKKLRDSRKKSS
tara:strand:+ start:347 stop:457 length:111 start_codon:yes stop_codon:yes gene_type:complete